MYNYNVIYVYIDIDMQYRIDYTGEFCNVINIFLSK